MATPHVPPMALQSSADRDANTMAAMIDVLERADPARQGMTTAEIVESVRKPLDPIPAWYGELKSAIEELCGKLDGRTLGYRFRHFARRNFGGKMIDPYNLKYRLNGKAWHDRKFTPAEIAVLTNSHAQGAIGQMLDVPLADLVEGDNTLEFVTVAEHGRAEREQHEATVAGDGASSDGSSSNTHPSRSGHSGEPFKCQHSDSMQPPRIGPVAVPGCSQTHPCPG